MTFAGPLLAAVMAAAGIYQPLAEGTTLSAVSRAYGVPVSTLMKVNRITDPTSIPAGTPIFVPGATDPRPIGGAATAVPGPLFAWPIEGEITSRFGAIRKHEKHPGMDIDGEIGDPIHAAADGTVAFAGDDAKYGLVVILDHGDGWTTWYGHASRILVAKGDEVTQGEEIALVGESGNARGSHLHFEIRRDDRPVNPLPFLAKGRARP